MKNNKMLSFVCLIFFKKHDLNEREFLSINKFNAYILVKRDGSQIFSIRMRSISEQDYVERIKVLFIYFKLASYSECDCKAYHFRIGDKSFYFIFKNEAE